MNRVIYFTDKSQKSTIAWPNTQKTVRAPFICDLLVKNLQNSTKFSINEESTNISLETIKFNFIIILQNYALTYIIESSNQAENYWLWSSQCTRAGFVLAKKFTLFVWKLTKHNFSCPLFSLPAFQSPNWKWTCLFWFIGKNK